MRTEDAEKLAVLWTAAQAEVTAFLRSVVDGQNVADLLQQVAVKLVRNFDRYDEQRPFVPWAIGIAKNEILAWRRQQATDRHRFSEELIARVADAFTSAATEDQPREDALHDAVWADHQISTHRGAHLVAGQRMKLQRGMVEITYRAGARCIVTGPAEFVLVDAMRCSLDRGKIAVEVSENAKGFVVETPRGSVTDLGTQFGVQVHDSGKEEVHVLKGVVEVQWELPAGTTKSPVRLAAGESLAAVPGQATLSQQSASADRFTLELPAPKVRPIAHWRFVAGETRDVINNIDGQLYGKARINQDALILGGDQTHAVLPDGAVRSPIEDAYTISLWVRVNKLRQQNIFVRTNDEGPMVRFSHQLFMDEMGHFVHYTYDGQARWIVGGTVARPETWHHVLLSAWPAGMRLFVDGRAAASWNGPLGKFWSEGNQFQIGNNARHFSSGLEMPALDGSVRDIRIYPFALNLGAINRLYREAEVAEPETVEP